MGLKNLAKQIKKDQKNLSRTKEELFILAIDNYLVKSTKVFSGINSFQPSSYHRCQRSLFYALKGLEETKKIYPRGQRTLQVGSTLHNWIQDMLISINTKNYGIKLLPIQEIPFYGKDGVEIIENHKSNPIEVKFKDKRWTKEIPISAMVDGVLEFMNIQMLFEFKTINTDDFKSLIEPLNDHIKQGALYALCTEIKKVMFLYLDKNTSHLKAYLVEYTDSQIGWVKERLIYIEGCVLNDIIPEKEADQNCKWCGYKSICEGK